MSTQEIPTESDFTLPEGAITFEKWQDLDIAKKMDMRMQYLATEGNEELKKELKKSSGYNSLTKEKQDELLKKYPLESLSKTQVDSCLASHNVKLQITADEKIEKQEEMKSKVYNTLNSSRRLKRYTSQIDKTIEARSKVQTIENLDPILVEIFSNKISEKFTNIISKLRRLKVFEYEPEIQKYLENIVQKTNQESEMFLKKARHPEPEGGRNHGHQMANQKKIPSEQSQRKTNANKNKAKREFTKTIRKTGITISFRDINKKRNDKAKAIGKQQERLAA